MSDLLIEGGVYATRASRFRWQLLRVLKLTEGAVHVRTYKRRFWRVPTIRAFEPEDWTIGHLPIAAESASQWAVVYLGTLPVEEVELEGFRIWEEDEEAGAFT
ncbi:MAG TPA: hypothetical protein VF701_08370 [Thermoanaerobaculia bacterium]